MAQHTGTTIVINPFDVPMHSSNSNASNISSGTMDSLDTYTGGNAKIIALKPAYKILNDTLQDEIVKQGKDLKERISDSSDLKKFLKDFQPELAEWVLQITNVYRKDTTDYDRLLHGGLTSFYVTNPRNRLTRIKGLIAGIGDDEALADLKIQVQAYADLLNDKIQKQRGEASQVKTDTATMKTCVDNASVGLFVIYGTLITVFANDPLQIAAFFPMNLIYQASNQKSYTKQVPKASKRKICIHTIKPGETFSMINNYAVDLLVALTRNAKTEPEEWYLLPAGAMVTNQLPSILGNTAFKYVMVKNEDIEEKGDITFIINVAPV